MEPKQPREEKRIPEEDDDEDEEEQEDEDDIDHQGFGRPRLDVFHFGETGPYEPLSLSSPGEIPVIQVNFNDPFQFPQF